MIDTLFLDIGGILLTNGWDRHARRRAVDKFNLEFDEMDERHHLTFDTYEEGKLSLDEYLNRIVFYKDREFSIDDFKEFMFSQSQPIVEMIEHIKALKQQYNLRIIAVSNEGRELTKYRIKKFGLNLFVDAFVSSSFVHFRKPDSDIFRMALDIAQAEPEKTVYIDDRQMFVQVAESLGIHGIYHTGFDSTRESLAKMGLALPEGAFKTKPGRILQEKTD